nr:MAG TPA: hypothetical protein [Caudoviricetes sp.]
MNMTKRTFQRYIEVTPEVRKDITQELGITHGCLSYALRYQRDGEVSRRARELAIAQGGVAYCTAPECETIHDADGKMTQIFPGDVVLIIDKTTSEAQLLKGGKVIEEYQGVTIGMLAEIQAKATSLNNN